MSRGSFSSWLVDQQDQEAGLIDEDTPDWERALPRWARNALGSFDDGVASTEGAIRDQLLPAALSKFLSAKTSALDSAAATLDATRRFRIFVGMLLVAFFFFAFAVFVGLPVLVLRPQKFALCFTMGSLSFMSSFAALRGSKAHLQTLCARDRLPFTAAYFATMVGTLWAAAVRRSFVLTVLFSGAQFATLLYYLGSFIPGGTRGVKVFLKTVSRTARIILGPILNGCYRCCLSLAS